MKRNKISIIFYSVLFSLILGYLLVYFDIFRNYKMQPFDIFTRFYMKDKKVNERIIVLLIDEASLKAMDPVVGRWPWPRYVHAEIIKFLKEAGAKFVVFDILFTESSEYDYILAKETGNAGNVIHSMLIYKDEGVKREEIDDSFYKRFGFEVEGYPRKGNNSYAIPVEEIYKNSIGVGVVTVEPDPDGVYRRIRLFHDYGSLYFPSLSISPLVYEGNKHKYSVIEKKLSMGNTLIPLDDDGNFLILNYGNIEAYSMSAVLKTMQAISLGNVEDIVLDPSIFKDKIVFIGASAVGLEDLKKLPVGNLLPGVYMHAYTLSNILDRNFIVEVGKIYIFIFSAVPSLLIALLISLSSSIYLQLFYIPLFVVGISASSYFLFMKGIYITPLYSFILVILSSLFSLSLRIVMEGRERRRIRRFLEQYVSPTVVSEVIENYDDFIKAGYGKKSYISVLFSDIRGFTTISESKSPEEVVGFLNEYFATMSEIVFSNKGTLDKFIGDALMAFWGEPVKVENPSLLAVKTALEMKKKLKELNEKFSSRGFPALRVGMGINSGYAVVGNIGSEKKLDYTAVGDTVNTASRLENMTKETNIDILISESTYNDVKDIIVCRYVCKAQLRGKRESIKVYEPLIFKDYADDEYLNCVDLLNEATELLQEGYFQKAEEKLLAIVNRPCDNYLKKIAKQHIIFIRGGGER